MGTDRTERGILGEQCGGIRRKVLIYEEMRHHGVSSETSDEIVLEDEVAEGN